MQDEPPRWLKDTLTQHSPYHTGGDVFCLGCNGMVVWTPEHVAREIHQRLSDAVASLYV